MDLWQTLFSIEDTQQLYLLNKPETKLEVTKNKFFYRLEINDVIQSAFAISAPYRPALPHCAVMLLPLLHDKVPTSVLELGGGGQAMQRYFRLAHPNVEFTSVEHDIDVYEANKCLPEFDLLDIKLTDAFEYVEQRVSKKASYHWIIVDLFHGKDTPDNAYNPAFFEQLQHLVSSGGWLIINCLNDVPQELQKLHQLTSSHLFEKVKAFGVPGQKNHIFLAQKKQAISGTACYFGEDIEQHNLFK